MIFESTVFLLVFTYPERAWEIFWPRNVGQTVQSVSGVYTFSDRSNETVFDTKSRRDALRIAQDASPGTGFSTFWPERP